MKDLNLRAKNYKTLRRKWENLHDIGFGIDFLDMTPKAEATKEKINQASLILKTFLHQRTLSRQ